MKSLTWEQVRDRKDKAASFVENVLQDPLRAHEIEDESVEDYAARRDITISNPMIAVVRRSEEMPQATKDELQEIVDDALEALNEVYHPESTREELAEAVGKAIDILEGEDEDGDEDEEGVDGDDVDQEETE